MSDETVPDALDGADPDIAAGELALGLLEREDRAAALRRVLAEPGFAGDVERWRGHIGQLFDQWPEMTPSSAVFARIEQSIAPARPGVAGRRVGAWWPALAAATTALAAILLAVIVLRPVPPAPQPTVVAQVPVRPPVRTGPAPILLAAIDPVASGSPVSAVYDPASGGLRLSEAALADANRSAELWIIGTDATPHSLGLLRTSGTSTFSVDAANRAQLAAGATLAVTLEAIGGSPTGLPQGPIVAKGTLSQV